MVWCFCPLIEFFVVVEQEPEVDWVQRWRGSGGVGEEKE